MDLDQLLTFERIVREGSFSKAAFALGVSQPTVSARVQALETSLGSPLFVRGRKTALTEQGERFLPFARRAIATLQDGQDAARLELGRVRGRLSVGVLPSLAGLFIGSALRAFKADYPEVEWVVRVGKHWDILELLYDGVIEMGFVCYPCLDPLLAELTPLLRLREPVSLMAAPSHPLAQQGTVHEQDVVALSQPFVLLRWWQVTPRHLERLAERARAADLAVETATHLLESGVGAGFYTKMVGLPSLNAGTLVNVPITAMPSLYRDTALVRLARRDTLSGTAGAFVAYVQKVGERHGLLL
jgi:LysR family carnitine catabolism transcriptional activator